MSTTSALAPGNKAPGAVPAVRVRPVPRTEPPTDDERRAAGLPSPSMTAPVLPLRMPTRRRRPSGRRGSGPPPVAGGPPRPAEAVEPTTGGSVVSPARIATRRFLAVCIEVLGGFRPATQLRALCLPERFEEIAQRLRVHTPGSRPPPPHGRSSPRGRAASPVPRSGPTGAPPRPGLAGPNGTDRVSIRRVQVCDAVDGVAEVAAVLSRREHIWAMALRLERRQDRWFCAHLEVI